MDSQTHRLADQYAQAAYLATTRPGPNTHYPTPPSNAEARKLAEQMLVEAVQKAGGPA